MPVQNVRHCCIVVFLLVEVLVSSLAAQPKPGLGGSSAVDVVTLRGGHALRGGIAWQNPKGPLTMALSLDWFRGVNAELATSTLADNLQQRQMAWIQTRNRITERLKSASDPPPMIFFLKQELDRINQLLGDQNATQPDFVWLDVSPKTILKVAKATPDQQRIALFAWEERLAHVETRDAASLKTELINKGIKIQGPLPDLSVRLPARPQEDREWEARMAVVEYALSKPLDFQGMGQTLARIEEGKAVNPGEVLSNLFQQQLGALLNDLASGNRPQTKPSRDSEWLKPATREAELSKYRGFRVTRLEIDATFSHTTVESRFVVQLPDGTWQTVWKWSATEAGTTARPEFEAQIEQDPRIKSALETLKLLGLMDAAAMQQAIRMGAGTMAAQQETKTRFAEFCDRYLRRLDGPPLPIIEAE